MGPLELKRLRESLGLSVEKMADRLKIPYGTYLKYEYGQRPIPYDLPLIVALANRDPGAVREYIDGLSKQYKWTEAERKKI